MGACILIPVICMIIRNDTPTTNANNLALVRTAGDRLEVYSRVMLLLGLRSTKGPAVSQLKDRGYLAFRPSM